MQTVLSLDSSKKYHGTYRGIVADNADPEFLQRLRVRIPHLFGTDVITQWAWPNQIPGSTIVPAIGQPVWVTFDNGNVENPSWTGIWNQISSADGCFAVPVQVYVGTPVPVDAPTTPGFTFPTTSIQETGSNNVAINSTQPGGLIGVNVGGSVGALSGSILNGFTVGGNLGVSGATTLQSVAVATTLNVTGTSTLGPLNAGATSITGNANVSGQMTAGTVSATTYIGLPTGLQLETTASTISQVTPGAAKGAGSDTKAAAGDHTHSAPGWGATGNITSSEPHDAVVAGATGLFADSGHQHARTLSESIFLGRNAGIGPVTAAGQPGNSAGFTNIPSGTTLTVTKHSASSSLLIWWNIGFFMNGTAINGVQGFISPGGALLFRLSLAGSGGGTVGPTFDASGGGAPFVPGLGFCHYPPVSSFSPAISGLNAGTYVITLQVGTANLNTGYDWYWNNNDYMTLVCWEA